MLIAEIIKMAWRALGANRLRSALASSGIMIRIFSIISIMTAISALQSSIENGLTFLGSNIFQFSKYPNGFETFGDERYKNRPNIDYQTYLNFVHLAGEAAALV